METYKTQETKKPNKLDKEMTPAQLARRDLKSSLPRKAQDRSLTAMAAMGEIFNLLDRFRGEVAARGLSKDTVTAALVYYQPEANPGMFANVVLLPEPAGIPVFVDTVLALDRPEFLSAFFHQVDPDAKSAPFQNTLFVVPLVSGPEEEGRLLFARERQRGVLRV